MENIPENNNSNQENEKDTANPGTKKKKYSKGFYVALAFCLLAMGAAAWTTYSSVSDYMKPAPIVEKTTTASTSKDKQAGVNVSGVPANDTTDPTSAASAQTQPTTRRHSPQPTAQQKVRQKQLQLKNLYFQLEIKSLRNTAAIRPSIPKPSRIGVCIRGLTLPQVRATAYSQSTMALFSK